MEEVWSFRYSKPALPEGPLVELSAAEMDGISSPNSTRRTLIKQMGCGNWLASTPGASSVTRRWTTCTRRWRFSLTRKAKRPVFSRWARPLNGFSDYESAIRFYKEALALEPAATRTWYLIHNNLGYCLNTLGRFAEGEAYCRKAIEIDSRRHNAFKNLGIALEGQGQFTDAARCYVMATKVNASDRRAYDLLENLLTSHPELRIEFATDAECCRNAVEFAANERARAAPVVHRGWRKQLILFRLRLKAFLRRFRRAG